MFRGIRRILLICFFGLLTVILHLMGRYAPDLVFLIYPGISQNLLRIVGGFFSLFPIAMWELLALTGLIWMVYTLIRDVSNLEIIRWVTGFLLTASVLVFALTLLWGLNNYSPPMHEKLELSGEESSVSRLKQAAEYYGDRANELANQIERNEKGEPVFAPFRELAREATDSYMLLAVEYDCFRGPRSEPKRLIFGEILGIEGIFVPFTGESGVSGKTYTVCLPFVMCREIGHGCGFTNRGEAEFAAFLACTASDSVQLQYSGYFNAFSLCYNALYARDPEAARQVWQGTSQKVRDDCAARLELADNSWTRAMGSLQEELRDAYARTFEYEEGEPEHDTVTDLLTMWYMEKIR